LWRREQGGEQKERIEDTGKPTGGGMNALCADHEAGSRVLVLNSTFGKNLCEYYSYRICPTSDAQIATYPVGYLTFNDALSLIKGNDPSTRCDQDYEWQNP
jgi:hypothetical protein